MTGLPSLTKVRYFFSHHASSPLAAPCTGCRPVNAPVILCRLLPRASSSSGSSSSGKRSLSDWLALPETPSEHGAAFHCVAPVLSLCLLFRSPLHLIDHIRTRASDLCAPFPLRTFVIVQPEISLSQYINIPFGAARFLFSLLFYNPSEQQSNLAASISWSHCTTSLLIQTLDKSLNSINLPDRS